MSNTPVTTECPTTPDAVVIGAGLAGLTAAALLARAGKSVVVREKRGVPGGDARSALKSGFTFNQGPHALYRGGPAERILTGLGVHVQGGKPLAKGKLVFEGQCEIAPAGPVSLLRTKALKGRDKMQIAKLLAGIARLRPDQYASSTVDEWVAATVSSERAAQMVHALIRLSTYVNAPHLLSADVAISQMQAALGPGVLYLDRGWQTLVDQLMVMPGVHLVVDDGVTELPDAPVVIIAGGGPSLAESLVGRTYDLGPKAAAACLDLGLRQAPHDDLVIGGDVPFYFSNHSAVATMAPAGHHHATAVQYLGEGDEPDHDAVRAFAGLAGVRDDDVIESRRLHRMTTVSAIPCAASGGLGGRPLTTDTGHSNVFVAGDWVGPVGHLADAALASAEAAAKAALSVLDSQSSSSRVTVLR